jgi:GH25 family lysozyme M1 (1,4-beta-N-acetylmuramidase)
MGAIEFNEDFAWRNGFRGGLVKEGTEGNMFAGIDPTSHLFLRRTKLFQAEQKLSVDGYFGRDTLTSYRDTFGEPSVQVLGIDVSGWQKPLSINYEGFYEAGYRFVIVKLCQGTGSISRYCSQHVELARAAGMEIGYYVFGSPYSHGEYDAREEVENALATLATVPAPDLTLTLDLEDKGYRVDKETGSVERGRRMYDLWENNRNEYKKRMLDWTVAWLEYATSELGKPPILYSYPHFLDGRLERRLTEETPRVSVLASYPLWLASRTLGKPREIPGWDRVAIQQWTSEGDDVTLAIYPKDLDLNRAPWGIDALRV